MWAKCPLRVSQLGQLNLPSSGVGKWVAMDYGGGDHQTADQGCVRLFGCRSMGNVLECATYRLYARSVSDSKSAAAAAVCGLWRYISVICLCRLIVFKHVILDNASQLLLLHLSLFCSLAADLYVVLFYSIYALYFLKICAIIVLLCKLWTNLVNEQHNLHCRQCVATLEHLEQLLSLLWRPTCAIRANPIFWGGGWRLGGYSKMIDSVMCVLVLSTHKSWQSCLRKSSGVEASSYTLVFK